MTVALVLAREASQSIPRKNLLAFHGRPLVAYPIMAAVEAGLETLLLSDGDELLRVGKRFGAAPGALPPELCDETGTIHRTLDYAIESLGLVDETIVALMGNSPTVSAETIRQALCAYESGAFTGVLTVAPVEDTHPLRLWERDGGRVYPFLDDVPREAINRQSCVGCVRHDGGPLVFSADYDAGETVYPFLGPRVGCVVRDQFGLDVHTPADLAVATYWLWLHHRELLPDEFVAPDFYLVNPAT